MTTKKMATLRRKGGKQVRRSEFRPPEGGRVIGGRRLGLARQLPLDPNKAAAGGKKEERMDGPWGKKALDDDMKAPPPRGKPAD